MLISDKTEGVHFHIFFVNENQILSGMKLFIWNHCNKVMLKAWNFYPLKRARWNYTSMSIIGYIIHYVYWTLVLQFIVRSTSKNREQSSLILEQCSLWGS